MCPNAAAASFNLRREITLEQTKIEIRMRANGRHDKIVPHIIAVATAKLPTQSKTLKWTKAWSTLNEVREKETFSKHGNFFFSLSLAMRFADDNIFSLPAAVHEKGDRWCEGNEKQNGNGDKFNSSFFSIFRGHHSTRSNPKGNARDAWLSPTHSFHSTS